MAPPSSPARPRIDVVDPSAFTPAYDHALCAALGRAGARVRLQTSHFPYGPVPGADGYERDERFYGRAAGGAGSRRRFAAKLAQHVPDMLRYRRAAAAADVVHFQWLTVQPLDVHLLPRSRPLVLTAHDILPREPRRGQLAAQRRLYERVDGVVVHSEHGRGRLVDELGLDPAKVHVIEHGAFEHLTRVPGARPLPDELAAVDKSVVLFFGLLRPYKGLADLLDGWRELEPDAELWIVGRPRMDVRALRASAPDSVRWVSRYVADEEVAAYFERADLVVLPYTDIDQSGVLFSALAFGSPLLLSDVGGFGEVAAQGAAALVAAGDASALAAAIGRLLADPGERARLAAGARSAAAGRYAWDDIARRHLELYAALPGSRA
jgi:glycosyltransferase involved in cell wall biosynthesis